MKLRIQGDSLRLRLTRPEVERLATEGRVEDTMHVTPSVTLRYALVAIGGDTALRAVLEGTTLTLSLPMEWLAGWPGDERVGFEGTQEAGGGRTLTLLVEKDFQCLHRAADEPDHYPNPLADDTA